MFKRVLIFLKLLFTVFFISFTLNYSHILIIYMKILIIFFLNKYSNNYFFIKNNFYMILYLHLNLYVFLKFNNKFNIYILFALYILIQIFFTIILYLFNYKITLFIDYILIVKISKSIIPYLYLTYILSWLYMRLNSLNYKSIYRKKLHLLVILFSYFFIFYDPIIFIDLCFFVLFYIIIPLFEFYFYTFVRPICKLCYLSGLLLTIICFDMFNEKGSIKKHIFVIIILCMYIYIKCYIIYAKKKCQIL